MTAIVKTRRGNFFEDFAVGQELVHATPRTVTAGDVALYTALYGGRFAVQSSDAFAHRLGFRSAPVDDLLVFHLVFGKSVPDVSLNAVANLGYAAGRFLAPVYRGDTLTATSRVIGLRQNSDGKSGIVYVRTVGTKQDGTDVLDYVRWVMVEKADAARPAPTPMVPDLPEAVAAADLVVPEGLTVGGYDDRLAGSVHRWDDYAPGERIAHLDGMTLEEAEHMLATRLYQNTAKVHFDQVRAQRGRFGRRLIYGGHIISLARSLSFNGLANAFRIAAINGGRHVAPCFAGDTVYAWSEVLNKAPIPGRDDVGALRLRTIALKDRESADCPGRTADGKYDPAVVLDFDYWVLIPTRS